MSLIFHDNAKLAVVGLGYVGLPLAVEFAKKYVTIGFDIDGSRIDELRTGHDRTKEVSETALKASAKLELTNDHHRLTPANVFVITVPTPIDQNKRPTLGT